MKMKELLFSLGNRILHSNKIKAKPARVQIESTSICKKGGNMKHKVYAYPNPTNPIHYR